MRSPGFALALAIAGVLVASTSFAQQRGRSVYQDQTVSPTAFEYSGYYEDGEEASPSDPPVDLAAPDEGLAAEGGDGYGCCPTCQPSCGHCRRGCRQGHCDCNCCGEEEEADDACGCEEEEEEEEDECPQWKLFDCCFLEERDITIGGLSVSAYTWNPANPADGYNGPVTWLDRANEYQMTRTWMYIEKAVDAEQCCCWDLGYRADAMYGTDSRFINATGLDLNSDFVPDWNRDHRFYGVVLPQFYVEAGYNDWKVRAGRFASPVGYFGIFTESNFFNTLPYTYQYGEPFTHTGATVSKKLNDNMSVSAGFITGWDNFFSEYRNAGFLGTATWTGDCGDSLAWVVVYSNEPNQNLEYTPRYFQTLVYQKPLNDCWTYVFQTDFGIQSNALAGRPGRDAMWYGINQYLIWKWSNCLSWGVNFEWFRDEDGFRVGGFLAPRPGHGDGDRGLAVARGNYTGSFYQTTFGPSWTPNKNWIIRPNIRVDWFDGRANNAGGLAPFNNGNSNSQFLLATDVIVKF